MHYTNILGRIRFLIARKIFNPLLRRFGYTIIADHFYQPIPNNKELLIYNKKERPLTSIQWNIENQIEFSRHILSQYSDEYNDPGVISSYGYSENKSGLLSGDTEFLYSMIRYKKPRIVIEVGTGGSTAIMIAALKKNFCETQQKTKFISIDPYPKKILSSIKKKSNNFMEFSLIEKMVQDVDLSVFESLVENDILFVDSSHVFKQGSDVEFEFLSLYPILRKGVIVHIHDIFFPFDYPLKWNITNNRFWNEQYFLETFLQFNSKFEIVASLSMVSYYNNEIFSDNIKAFHKEHTPGSFWMISV